MQREHRICHGECLADLSSKSGFADTTSIRRADENSDLFSERTDANALHPGDRVLIPDIRSKDASIATEARHRFRRLRPKKPLRLRFGLSPEEPFDGSKYTLRVWGGPLSQSDALVFEGTLDSTGGLMHEIPLQSDAGEIEILTGEKHGDRTLKFGLHIDHMSPHDMLEGVQARLDNLGYDVGPINGKMTEKTALAIRRFQASQSLNETGQLDKHTTDHLKQIHGC